jgi:RNA polymerase sigma factor (sigma-70 family)
MEPRADADLLRDYADHGAEPAFGELVRRHADLVYSAALRQVGDPEAARDVAQSVFTDLAQKAGKLPGGTVLVGWLHRSTRYAALNELRSQRRRQQRERLAMELLEHPDAPATEWDQIRPVLDEALTGLGHADRDALLLRFFRNQSLADVGAALGVSEDAAQKRVTRALDKLRELLSRRGVKTTVASLGTLLLAEAVQAAPAGLAVSLSTGALAAAAQAGWSVTTGFAAMKPLLPLALAAGLVALTAWQVKTRGDLGRARDEARQLMSELSRLRSGAGADADLQKRLKELDQLRLEAADVYRLRGEVTRLRAEAVEQKQAILTAPAADTNSALVASNAPVRQVMIEAKFVEIPVDLPTKLPIATLPKEENTSVILKDDVARQLILYFEKSDGANVLSAPRVTTVSGRQAQVSVSDIQEVYDPLTDASTNLWSGVELDVLPIVGPEGAILSLTVMARINEFLGYQTTPAGPRIKTRLRQAVTSAQVADGMTLVLAAGVVVDEVAAPGGSQQDPELKRVIILITPTVIDGSGNPVRKVSVE